MSLISISLDVVGSTSIKNDLSEFATQHGSDLDRHYSDVAKLMLVSMNRFSGAGFVSDTVKVNVKQVFKLLSPATEIKTL